MKWEKDLHAFVAFRAHGVDDFTFVATPGATASETVASGCAFRNLSCIWGQREHELIFSDDLTKGGWTKASMTPGKGYPTLPNVGNFAVKDLAVFAVHYAEDSEGHAAVTCDIIAGKMKKLAPCLTLNPHFRPEELGLLANMSRHRIQRTFCVGKKQELGAIRRKLEEGGMSEVAMPATLIPSFDTALSNETGVRALRIPSAFSCDIVQKLQIAFSQPEGVSHLTTLMVTVTPHSIDALTQLLRARPVVVVVVVI